MFIVDGKVTKRFWPKVEKADGCWLWTAGRNHQGYGNFCAEIEGVIYRSAHRASWVIHNGPVPTGLWVLHRCDNPPCVNPDHLFLGTCKDNVRDMISKGRKRNPIGELAGAARLTDAMVLEIRRRHAYGECRSYLAEEFNVGISTIVDAVDGNSWSHLPQLGTKRICEASLRRRPDKRCTQVSVIAHDGKYYCYHHNPIDRPTYSHQLIQ